MPAEAQPEPTENWDDDNDHVRTASHRPSQQVAAQLRSSDQEQTRNERRPSAVLRAQGTAPSPDDDDLYGQTIVAPPVFVDEESTIGQAEREAVAAAVLGRDARPGTATGVDDDDAAPTLDGTTRPGDEPSILR